ncbi:MAG: transporter, family, tetracycline resistance protein [Candidatus Sumerlaeota bacterium]|nr:transporter, family, tetracycline resistance protein [Candidatus Sumerlaeota bacterium]
MPGKRQLAGLFLPMMLLFASMALVSPSLDVLVRERFGVGNAVMSGFMGVHSLPQILLLGLAIGMLSDRLGRRLPLIGLGLLGTGITTALLPWITSWPLMLTVRFLDGLLGLMAFGLLLTRVVDLTDAGTRPRVMAVLMAAIPAGYLTGSALIMQFGLTRLSWVFGGVGAAVALAGAWQLAEARGEAAATRSEEAARAGLRRTLRSLPRLWLPMLFGFVDKFTFSGFAVLTAPFLADALGVEPLYWTSMALVAFWLAFLVASPLAGRFAGRFGSLRVVTLCSLLYGGLLCLLGTSSTLSFFIGLMGLCGALTAMQYIANATLAGQLVSPADRAAGMEAFHMAGSWGMFVGFGVLGVTSAHSYAAAFGVAGGLEILCALTGTAILLFRPRAHEFRPAKPRALAQAASSPAK